MKSDVWDDAKPAMKRDEFRGMVLMPKWWTTFCYLVGFAVGMLCGALIVWGYWR